VAIIGVKETWASDLQTTLDDEGKTQRVAKRILTGYSDDVANDSEATATAAFPQVGAVHPRLGFAFLCRNVRIVRKSALYYECTATYRTNKQDDPTAGDYPWDQPATVAFFDVSETGPTEFDANDAEIATVNGEPFSVPREYADQGIRIDKAFLAYNPAAFYLFRNKVNSDTFLSFPPGVLRVTGIQADPDRYEGVLYYNVTVTIVARSPINTTDEKAWYHRQPQKGYLVKTTPTATEAGHAVDDYGKPVREPVFILANGTKKTDSDPVHFLEIQRYDTTAFSGMNLF
jgi:hypothetical protein